MSRTQRVLVAFVAAIAAAPALVVPASQASAVSVDQVEWVSRVVDGDTAIVSDGRTAPSVRLIGLQANELTTYSGDSSLWRGQCHAVEAGQRLSDLALGKQVRVTARHADSRAGMRYWRAIAIWNDGAWRDVSTILAYEGHGLFNPHKREYQNNLAVARASQAARAARRGMFNPTACGIGPSQGAALSLSVRYNPPGDERSNVNSEWVRIHNRSPYTVPLGGWHVRDGAFRGTKAVGYTFPSRAKVPANSYITLRAGKGTNTRRTFYWGLSVPPFENPSGAPAYLGDGAYLTDPQLDIRASRMWPRR